MGTVERAHIREEVGGGGRVREMATGMCSVTHQCAACFQARARPSCATGGGAHAAARAAMTGALGWRVGAVGVGAGAGGAVERSVVGAGCALQSAAAASADPAAPDTRHSGRHVSGGWWVVGDG